MGQLLLDGVPIGIPERNVTQGTVSGTTDSSGVLVTSYTASDSIILAAICAGNIVQPFVNASYAWQLKVTDTNGTAKASTAVTVYVYYVEAP